MTIPPDKTFDNEKTPQAKKDEDHQQFFFGESDAEHAQIEGTPF